MLCLIMADSQPQKITPVSQIPAQSSDAWKVGFFILLIVVLIILALIGFYIYMQSKPQILPNQPSPSVQIVPSIQPSPSLQASVMPSITPSATPQQSVQPSPQNTQSDVESIKQAMAKKHNKQVSEVKLTVSKNTGQFAQGSVSFEGEMGGGWFLAAKTASGWVIVQDGNGTISCQTIAPYNFPVSIVPECWDETTNKTVNR